MAKNSVDNNPADTPTPNGHVNGSNHAYTHTNKRKRLKKPKSEPVSCINSIDDILKPSPGDPSPKIECKPCRRSERRTIPNSLWENAVINPFYERKRRKVDTSTGNGNTGNHGNTTGNHGNSPGKGGNDVAKGEPEGKAEHVSNENSIKQEKGVNGGDATRLNGTNNETAESYEIAHVRLRRSSRKLSSSVSSLSDTKNPLKQERLVSRRQLEEEEEEEEGKDEGSPVGGKPPLPTMEGGSPATNGNTPPDVPPKREPELPLPMEEEKEEEGQVPQDEEEGEVKGRDADLAEKPKGASKPGVRRRQRRARMPNHLKQYQLPTRRESRRMKPPMTPDKVHPRDKTREKSVTREKSITRDKSVPRDKTNEKGVPRDKARDKTRDKTPEVQGGAEVPTSSGAGSPSNESDDIVINSKEALSLIDGTSFHRFYRMRTRRQNSSTDEVNAKKVPEVTRKCSKGQVTPKDTSGKGKGDAPLSEPRKRVRRVKPDILCSFCLLTVEERHEELISCFLCGASGHPSCLQFNAALTQRVKLYNWECIECKKCELCRKPGDDATLLFCDDCDKGFHMGCLKPALNGQPDGHWACMHCADGSTYWKDRIRENANKTKQVRRRKSDKVSKRKQLLDDLAMFHEAQKRAKIAMDEELKKAPKIKTPRRKSEPNGKVPPSIKSIEFGSFEISTWYNSPYPAEYVLQHKLYICEFCLKYMKSGVIASRHSAKCLARCPPGDEIYRKDSISVFEVDGKKNKTYCQNLCLLAKLFLDHKTLYYDVEPFLFYILTEYDRRGCHIVGYFSKEKNSFLCYNVSCILVLPPYMKKGYGKMLIDFSYVLSKKEGKLGSPEKPLSDLGLISYRNYWKEKLLEYFSTYTEQQISIKDISHTLGFNPYDIVSTLQAYGMIKYFKTNHYILKRPEMIAAYKRKQNVIATLPDRSIDLNFLKWVPPQKRDGT